MEIRNNAEALKAFLGVSTLSGNGQTTRRPEMERAQAAFGGDEATLSQVGTEFAGAAGQEGVRMEKVVAVQQALAAGTYSVPASEVAGKVIDAMLATGSESER
jgi:anti-sigma28 factor (negative regulator of flagellin synthesis)